MGKNTESINRRRYKTRKVEGLKAQIQESFLHFVL